MVVLRAIQDLRYFFLIKEERTIDIYNDGGGGYGATGTGRYLFSDGDTPDPRAVSCTCMEMAFPEHDFCEVSPPPTPPNGSA